MATESQSQQSEPKPAKLGLSRNLEDQLVFYGSYHNNVWNQLIHVIFVPVIFWSAIVFFCYSGPLVPSTPHLNALISRTIGSHAVLPAWIGENIVFNLAFPFFSFYCLYYLSLGDLPAAASFNVVLLGLFIGANAFYTHYTAAGDKAWVYALAIHVFSWYMQIHPGHAVLEGRRPALFDSLFQSLVLAPLFVWYHVLFPLGYRKDFNKKLQARIDGEILKWKASRKQA